MLLSYQIYNQVLNNVKQYLFVLIEEEPVMTCDHETEFDCYGDGLSCVDLTKVCDRSMDCSNGADEQWGPDQLCAAGIMCLNALLNGILFCCIHN